MSVFLGESSSCGDLALKVQGQQQQQQGRTGNQGEWVITDQANAATITFQHPLCYNEIIISVLSDAGQTSSELEKIWLWREINCLRKEENTKKIFC